MTDNVRELTKRIYASIPHKQRLFELARMVGRPPEKLYRHLHFDGIIRIPVSAQSSFWMRHYGYQVENDLFWAGFGNGWEGTSLRLWARMSRSAQTVFDVGANTGVYALAAKLLNPDAKVFAFEPVTRIATRLRENVRLNGFDIEVVVAGASDHTGKAFIYDPPTEHAYSASLEPTMMVGTEGMRCSEIAVTRIDDFVATRELGSADLFKIDAEKHELRVLSGFGEVVSECRPAFLIEVLGREIGAQLETFFAPHHYRFYEIRELEGVRRVDRLGGASRNHLVCSEAAALRHALRDEMSHRDLEL